MSTELALNTDYETLAALTGAMAPKAVTLPKLAVNREPLDNNNKPLPMGHFTVTQNEVSVYGEKAVFRPFINGYQYSVYSASEKKYTNSSIIIKSWNEEAIDRLGGIACGKIKKDQLEHCSAEEQIRQKNIKCNRLVFGTVTFTDTDIKDLPVVWRMGGTNFMAADDALKALGKMKHHTFNHAWDISTVRAPNAGTTIMYDIIIKPNFKKLLTLDESTLEVLNLFKEVIDRENSYVIKDWKEAKRNKVKSMDLSALDLNDDISDL